jgi:hypothetical protein
MAQRTKSREELDGQVLRAAASERSMLVAGLLQPGEALAADPAICLLERSAEVRSPPVEGILYATDRRLLFCTTSAQSRATWPYRHICGHRVDPCTYHAFFRPLPFTTWLRARRRYFATFTFATADGEAIAAHGSRPFLEAIASVMSNADHAALRATARAEAVHVENSSTLACGECRSELEGFTPYCPGCGRTIDRMSSP